MKDKVLVDCTKGFGCKHDHQMKWTSTEATPSVAEHYNMVVCGSSGCQHDGQTMWKSTKISGYVDEGLE